MESNRRPAWAVSGSTRFLSMNRRDIPLLEFGVWAINEILWTRCGLCFQLFVVAGRNILFQAPEKSKHFHIGWDVTDPDMDAGFELIKMFLDLKARVFHKICGKESCDPLNDPRVFFKVSITNSKFRNLRHRNIFQRCG